MLGTKVVAFFNEAFKCGRPALGAALTENGAILAS